MPKTYCAAVDLGATSGRVILGTWNGRQLTLAEVHRFPNLLRSVGAHDYWEIGALWTEVRTGLGKAVAALPKGACIASVGVDTWGCDHVLVNDAGRIVFPVHAYRDNRTQIGLQRLARTPAALTRIYEATGIPNVFYNSSLQLAETVASCPSVTDLATRCLFLPDFFNYLLSGRMENELSIASTTQLLDVHSCEWSRAALDHFHLPPHWFTTPVRSGTRLGSVKGLPELKGTRVIAVPGHDTASAYDAMPANPDGNDLYLSSGTWSLVGFESDKPVLGPDALKARVANERTGDGHWRPLTNVIGFWLLEGVMKEFKTRPQSESERASLNAAAAALPNPRCLIDTEDPAFANPPSMRAAIDAQLRRKKASPPRDLAGYLRLICESLGVGHARAKDNFEKMTGRSFSRILVVGGGSRNKLMCQATANSAGVPVVSYNLEGTAVGNLARQLISLGEVAGLRDFRNKLARDLKGVEYTPSSK